MIRGPLLFLMALSATKAFCPFKCQCDDRKMKVVCSAEANLDIIPITLNPGIKEIHLRGNQIRYFQSTLCTFFLSLIHSLHIGSDLL